MYFYKTYVGKRVVFWKNLHSWHKFYTTASRAGRDKSQLCYPGFWTYSTLFIQSRNFNKLSNPGQNLL